MMQITQEVLLIYLRYESETGHLYWIKKSSDKTVVGARAGWQRSLNGYRQIGILGQIIYEHRLVWLIVTGEMPKHQVDHKNGIKDDNRFENLRTATSSQNVSNIGAKRDNTSGAKNVHWCNRAKKWIAKVKSHGKTYGAGAFKDYEDAVLAASIARLRIHGEFANHEARDSAMCAWQYRGAK